MERPKSKSESEGQEFEDTVKRFDRCLEVMMKDERSYEVLGKFNELKLIFEELAEYLSSSRRGGGSELAEGIQDNFNRYNKCIEDMKNLMKAESSNESAEKLNQLYVLHEAMCEKLGGVGSSTECGSKVYKRQGSQAKFFEENLKRFRNCAEEMEKFIKVKNFGKSTEMLTELYIIYEDLQDDLVDVVFPPVSKTTNTSKTQHDDTSYPYQHSMMIWLMWYFFCVGSKTNTKEDTKSSLPLSSKTKEESSPKSINKKPNKPIKKSLPKVKETKVTGPKMLHDKSSSLKKELQDEMALREGAILKVDALKKMEEQNKQRIDDLEVQNKRLTRENAILEFKKKQEEYKWLCDRKVYQQEIGELKAKNHHLETAILETLKLDHHTYSKAIANKESQIKKLQGQQDHNKVDTLSERLLSEKIDHLKSQIEELNIIESLIKEVKEKCESIHELVKAYKGMEVAFDDEV